MLSQITRQTHSQLSSRWQARLSRQRQRWEEMSSQIGLLAAFAAVYLIWGSTFLAIRFAIETIPPFLMAGSRFLLAGAVLYIWARLRGAARPQRVHWRTALITGGLMLLAGNGVISWAEQYVSSGMAALLVATVPMWAVLIGAISNRERPARTVVAGLGLGLLGVALLIGPGNIAGGESSALTAVLVILAACFSWALGTHYSRRATQPSSQHMATAMNLLAGGSLLVIFSTVRGEYAGFELASVTLKSGLALAYLAVFGSIVGFSAYMWLVKVTTPARASSNFYVNPAVGVFLGWWLAGETITTMTVVATGVIVSAVVLIVSQKKRAKPEGK